MLHIEMRQIITPFQIVQLIKVFHVVPFEVQHLQVLNKTNVKQLIYFIITYVQFFQLFECLYALNFFEFTSSNVEHPHVLEGRTHISEATNY